MALSNYYTVEEYEKVIAFGYSGIIKFDNMGVLIRKSTVELMKYGEVFTGVILTDDGKSITKGDIIDSHEVANIFVALVIEPDRELLLRTFRNGFINLLKNDKLKKYFKVFNKELAKVKKSDVK